MDADQVLTKGKVLELEGELRAMKKAELFETESKETEVVYIEVAEGNCSNVSEDGVNRESRADSEHAKDAPTEIKKPTLI